VEDRGIASERFKELAKTLLVLEVVQLAVKGTNGKLRGFWVAELAKSFGLPDNSPKDLAASDKSFPQFMSFKGRACASTISFGKLSHALRCRSRRATHVTTLLQIALAKIDLGKLRSLIGNY